MGTFTDTKYVDIIDSLHKSSQEKLANPYYKFNDKNPTKITYYKQNEEKSTVDPVSGLYGAHIGAGSPFKFNKIIDFVVYGIDRMNVEFDSTEYGTEANPITGEFIVLPNTIRPIPGDFFSIPYLKDPILFKVNSCSPDTLNNGANVYRCEFALEKTGEINIETIESQVVKTFHFIVSNVGTNFNTMIEDGSYDTIGMLEALNGELITYFTNIFFNSRLQTFVYNHDGWLMYDPSAIEFMIRNKILNSGDKYIYVSHAITLRKTFAMDYMKTFFYALEHTSEELNPNVFATGDLIQDVNSLFTTRLEDYYEVRYVDDSPYKTRFQVFDPDIMDHIRNNTMYDAGSDKEYYNLWIAFFNNNMDAIDSSMIDLIRKTEYMDNLECFYALLITMFIIEKYIANLAS